MKDHNPLLQMKMIMPAPTSGLVARDRLFDWLDGSQFAKLTLICAPAGYGKTTLMSTWLSVRGHDAAWISIDPQDAVGGKLWRYLVKAIDRVLPGYEAAVSEMLPVLATSEAEQALVVVLNELQRSRKRLCLVLDDLHEIQDEQTLRALAYFTAYLPSNVHLYLLSRTEPGFPTGRLEALEAAERLDMHALRFTSEEAEAFFKRSSLPLSQEQSWLLLEKTEGWISALKLAAFSLRRSENWDTAIRRFSGDSIKVKQYLLEEIWASQSETMQRFLMRCSVLKRWNTSLCRSVTDDENCETLIEELQRQHLFIVSWEESGTWFRFHPLFSEFLRDRLERYSSENPTEIYYRAGGWCAEHELEEEAIEYYLMGAHYEEAIARLKGWTARIVTWDWAQLRAWLSQIPMPILMKHPSLFFSYVNSFVAEGVGELARAELLMEQAERWAAEQLQFLDERTQKLFLAMNHYVRGTIHVFGYNELEQARDHYAKVIHYAPDGIPILYGSPDKPLQPVTARAYRIATGQAVREVAEPYTLQMEELFRAVDKMFLGRLYVNHAEMLYQWNELDEAEVYAKEGLKWAALKSHGAEYELVPGWIVLADVQYASGRECEAYATLLAGQRDLAAKGIRRGVQLLELEHVRLRARSGETSVLLDWLECTDVHPGERLSLYELYDYEVYVRALLASGELMEASSLLDQLIPLAGRELKPLDHIELMMLRTLLLTELGESDKALDQLEQALRLADLNGFQRVIMDEGAAMCGLIADLITAKQAGRYRGSQATSLSFVRSIFAGIGGMAEELHPLAALLTSRELEVFHCLVDDLGGKQIAERLHISYETVKSHRKHIYEKLGVRTREEALRRAEQLGMAAPPLPTISP